MVKPDKKPVETEFIIRGKVDIEHMAEMKEAVEQIRGVASIDEAKLITRGPVEISLED